MRILQLIDSLEAGGAERMAVNLANALHQAGVSVVLVASRAGGVLETQLHKDIPYYCLHKQRTLDIKAFKCLKGIVITHKIDLIHAHSSSFFMATWLKWRLAHLKLVWHDHYGQSEHLAQRPARMLSYFSRWFNGIIAVNQQLADWANQVLKHGYIKVLFNFVVISPTETATTTLQGTEGKRLLCLANLRPQKDHFNLIEAFRQVSVSHSDWTLHLVGKDFKDDYSERVRQAVKEADVETKVCIYDSCEDVGYVLAQSQIGVLSSQSEGLPLALLEYGLAGLPVVATAVGDVPNVIKHQNNGLLVLPNNADALAAALNELITRPEVSQRYGEALQSVVQQQYSAEASVAHLLVFYKRIVHATHV
jgi:glycosyltransferase involved in cell wall biosynthesis